MDGCEVCEGQPRGGRVVRMLRAVPVVVLALAGAAFAQEQPAKENSPTASQPVAPAAADRPPPGIAAGESIAEKAKAFKLTDSEGRAVSLDSLYREGPLVVVFYYGSWSPLCVRNLVAWQQKLEEVRELGAQVVAVSPESQERSARARDNHLLEIPLLSDTDGAAMRAFEVLIEIPEEKRQKYRDRRVDIGAMNACGCWEVPIPAAFVIDGEGMVRGKVADWDPRKRPEPEKVLEVVRGMFEEGEK